MAGRSSKADNRGADLFGMLVSGKSKDYHTFKSATRGAAAEGMSASGGILNEFTQNGNVYRSHTFTGSGNFVVESLSSDFPNTVEYLVVAGGASAGAQAGGGGGAGGLKSTDPAVPTDRRGSAVPVAVASYPVVIGAGGATASVANINRGQPGGTSSFAYNGGTISCDGGGGGGG